MSYNYYITPGDYETAAANGIKRETLEQRVRVYGWEIERATTQPLRKQKNRKTWRALADQNGITPDAFYRRLKVGWDPARAATEPMVSKAESLIRARESYRKYPQEWLDLAAQNGISLTLFRARVRVFGWSYEKAATEPKVHASVSGRHGKEALIKRYGNINALLFRKRG
ncbi:hypothetical protein NSS79_15340 [Paenibacillus sp. FSL L8-0436]|uniref:hypothetical protein n=1 Tax=Paenibacillus sp. FSL L8-0436 TaxID=2954686 RepID=UPI00315916EE